MIPNPEGALQCSNSVCFQRHLAWRQPLNWTPDMALGRHLRHKALDKLNVR